MIDNYFGKIYYINLPEDISKKKYIDKEILKSHLLTKQCSKYTAVVGQYLDIRLLPEHLVTEKAKTDILAPKQKTYGITLTYGSVACAMSHYLIYQECKNQKKPFMIFEDDFVIGHDFDTKLNQALNHTDTNFDILYLGYNNIPGFQKVIIDNVLSKPRGLITGLYGYVLTPKGAAKIIKYVFPLNQQIDSSISNHIDKFELICCTNAIVGVRTDFGSKTQSQKSTNNVYKETVRLEQKQWDKLFS